MNPVKPLGLLLALLAFSPAHAAPATLDRIVAVVNDGVVLESELRHAVDLTLGQIRERGMAAPPAEALRTQVLERLILTRLQTQRAQEAGIRVDDRELNEVLTTIAAKNGLSIADFAEALKRDGVDYLSFREQIRDEVLIGRLRQREVEGRVMVTDQDIDLFLAGKSDSTEYRLSHILVALPDGATPEQREAAKREATALHERLRKGEDFAAIALAHSDGQQALQGGDLDWRQAGDLPTLFAEQAQKLQADEISPVLDAPSGFHIVKLTGKRGGDPRQVVTETRARHILLSTNALRDEEATRLQARQLHDRLQKGETFEKLAKEHSDDPGSKNSGGDLGWNPPGVFAPEFQIRIDQLKPGEVATPFRTQFGWHIARVEERRTRDTTDASRRARARAAIQNRKAAEEYEVWLRRLRDEAYVEYRLDTPGPAATKPS